MQAFKRTKILSALLIFVVASATAEPPSNHPLHKAIKNGDFDRFTGLLQAGHDPDEVNELGQTALHYAAARFQDRGYLYVSELLRFGADPDAKDTVGATVLRYAAESGLVSIASLLVEHGADVNTRSAGGGYPLAAAYIHGHMDIAGLLESYGARIASEGKRRQLQAVGRINAVLRSSSRAAVGESAERKRALIARALHDMRDEYGLHDQLSDEGIRRMAQEESSSTDELVK